MGMDKNGYSNHNLHFCDVENLLESPDFSHLCIHVHLCLSVCIIYYVALLLYSIPHVKWITRWSQGRANPPMLAAMTVENT